MKFPKIKNALCCYFVFVAMLIGVFAIPFVLYACLSHISEWLSAITLLVLIFAELIILVINIPYLISVEVLLAIIHNTNKSRKYFVLPKSFDKSSVVSRIARFGKKYEPIGMDPKPELLRYKATSSMTVLSCGIEKIVALYNVDLLDKETYLLIKRSVMANSKALAGNKKVFADRYQKSEPLNRATVFYIFADSVGADFKAVLYEETCKGVGDGFDEAFLSCVVDFKARSCYFDSMRIPCLGDRYPSKNRGINLIRKHLFNNHFTYAESKESIADYGDFDGEMTLWKFMRDMKKEFILDTKKTKKRFEKMRHKEIIVEDEYLYLKWNDKGLWISVDADEEASAVTLDAIEFWDYPKHQRIAKQTIADIKRVVNVYYSELGYCVKYKIPE